MHPPTHRRQPLRLQRQHRRGVRPRQALRHDGHQPLGDARVGCAVHMEHLFLCICIWLFVYI